MKLLFNLVVAVLLFGSNVVHAGEDKQLFKVSTGEYSPYTSKSLPHYGIDCHIVSMAFKAVDINASFEFLPLKRAYDHAEKGKVDGSLPWTKQDGREVLFYYSDPIIEVDREYLYFLNANPIAWDSVKQDYLQLSGKAFSAVATGNYGEKFQKAEADGTLDVVRVQDEQHSIKMLLRGHVDALIGKRRVVDYALHKYFNEVQRRKISFTPESNAPTSYDYLLISKRAINAEFLLDRFNEGMKMIKQDGRYNQLMEDFKNGQYADF